MSNAYTGRPWDELSEAEQNAIRTENLLRRIQKSKRMRARQEVSVAVKEGRMTRQPCAVCGHAAAEGHHEDYGKPLEVTWLCRKHHMDRHAESVAIDAEWLSVSDVARLLSVSTKQIRKWLENGQFDEIAVFSKRVTRISIGAYRRFVEKSRAA